MKNLIHISLCLALSLSLGACSFGDDGWDYLCDDVDCSGHGTCVAEGADSVFCECDQGFQREGLTCVEEIVVSCDDVDSLRADALRNGQRVFSGVGISSSTPIADILANPGSYENQVVQIEGLVYGMCTHSGGWAGLQDPDGNQLILKVEDGTANFMLLSEIGNYAIGEGVYTSVGEHGPQVYINAHGAVVGEVVCPLD